MDEDLEVLDLTTPQPPTPISRLDVASSAGVSLLPSPRDSAGSNEARAGERGGGAGEERRELKGRERFNPQEWESNGESDDDFSMSLRVPLRERLKLKTAPTSTASPDSTQAGASTHSIKTKSPRRRTNLSTDKPTASNFSLCSTSTPALSTAWEMYLGDSDDEREGQSGRAVCEGKSRNSEPGYEGRAGGSGSQEKRTAGAATELVNLLSDSDDDERGTRVAKGGGVTANAEDSSAADRDPDLEQAGLEDPLGIDDFDTLMLSSQTSSRSSLSRPTRAHRDTEQSDPGGSNLSMDMPDYCRDDDDFSLDSLMTGATRYTGGGGGISYSSSGNGSLSGGAGQGERNVVADAPRTREEKALARKEAAASKKRQREEAAAAAKQKREQERLARKLRAEAEKAEKAARAEKAKQANGRYSHLEIACVMDRGYFEDSRSAAARAAAARQPNGTEEFVVAHGDLDVPGGIWWTRRAHLDGGAAATGPGVETLDIFAVVVYPEQLLQNLRYCGDASDGNVFPDLGRFVDDIRASAKAFNRIILILEGAEIELNKQWGRPQRDGSTATRTEVFEDAQSWLLIHKDVETRVTKDGADTGQYLWDFTRALSTIPYKDEVTELHCVPRFKARARGSDNLPLEDQKLADTWVRMLLQIPDIGESKAVEIAAHYPLPRDLVRALSDPGVSEEERAVLLADKMGSGRQERKYARRIFDLFTHEDGNFVLN